MATYHKAHEFRAGQPMTVWNKQTRKHESQPNPYHCQECGRPADHILHPRPTLPTMETVAADRAAAAGESQAAKLAEMLRSPLPSISRITGDMEVNAPLFRESPANPQQNLF